MITLQINGIDYTNFVSLNVEQSIENVYGTFNFVATTGPGQNFPIKAGSFCRVLVDATPILTGYVEDVNIDYDANAHQISCSGRDLTCDIYDSQLDGDIEFVPPVTLETIIKQTAKKININNIKVINEAGTIEPFQQSDLVSARIGQTVFNFIETYARKRQVFITTDGLGNIVLARGSSQEQVFDGIYNMIGDPLRRNNVKRSSVKYNNTNRFNLYRCKSQGNPVTLNFTGDTSSSEIVERDGTAIDPFIRNTRILNFNAENSSDGTDVANRAVWEANIRRSRSKVWNYTVQGDTYRDIPTGIRLPWRVNRLVQVIDDFADINGELLVRSVNFRLSVDEGTTTTLELVTPDGYTPEASLSKQKLRVNKLGDEFYIIQDPTTNQNTGT